MGDALLRSGYYAPVRPFGKLPGPDDGVGCCALVFPCCSAARHPEHQGWPPGGWQPATQSTRLPVAACHPVHQGRPTATSCAGCACWTVVCAIAGVLAWAFLTFVVIQGEVCKQMETQLHPEQTWLEHTAKMNPSNWEFAGSQSRHCTAYMESIRVEDWRVPASEYREVFFRSSDGLRLQGFFLIAQNGNRTGMGPASQAPTIIQVHGHGPYVGQQSQMVPAKAMQQQGFNVFVFNNQGLGRSEAPNGDYAMRAFGADEITNTEGAIGEVTQNPNGALPFATPLRKVGIYTESGGNGMVLFLRQDIPGLITHGSIYDWYLQFNKMAKAQSVLGMLPMMDRVMMNCASAQAQRGGILKENYKDQLDRDVYDPTGRKVFVIHNKADEYNPFDHALGWVDAFKAKGFDVTPYFPDEDAEERCNSHITIFWGLDRKKHFKEVCKFWERAFGVQADCSSVLAFDTKLNDATL